MVERGLKETIYVKLEPLSLNSGGGLQHHLSAAYSAILASLLRPFNSRSHFFMWPNDTYDGRVGQLRT